MLKVNQVYLNIAGGVTIGVLVACILAGFAWIGKLQVTVNKADRNWREIERNEKEMMRKNKVYHMRLGKNEKDIKDNRDIAMRADVQSEINFQLYMKEH